MIYLSHMVVLCLTFYPLFEVRLYINLCSGIESRVEL